MAMNFFKKKQTPKEATREAKREARREVRVSRVCVLRLLLLFLQLRLWTSWHCC